MAMENRTAIVTDTSSGFFSPRVLVAICLLGSLSVIPAGSPGSWGQAQETPPSTTTSTQGNSEEGKKIFRGRCSRCHLATSTKERLGPGLKGLFEQEKLLRTGLAATDGNVRKVIVNGSRSMPPFGRVITDEQLDDLIAYLRTL